LLDGDLRARATGEHWTDAFLHRIRGEISLKRDLANTASAEEALLTAIEIAQQIHSRYGLHTRAVTVYRDPLIRRLQPLRYLHDCSGCFRLERLPGGPCTPWKAPPFHGARQQQTHAVQQINFITRSPRQLGRVSKRGS
jgi:hypothetical protein